MLDIVAALEWVRDNIERFGGDPNLVTIFGQSGGGRKVATLMSMPSAKGLFHRAIIESGAVLRLTTPEDGHRTTEMLLAELGLKRGQARELQNVPMEQLVAGGRTPQRKIPLREPGHDGELADSRRRGVAVPSVGSGRRRRSRRTFRLLIGYAQNGRDAGTTARRRNRSRSMKRG